MQISYDFLNLPKALDLAKQTVQFTDILEVGAPLVYMEGIKAVETFKKQFPNKPIFADIKIVDRVQQIIQNFAEAGATYISVLGGTSNFVIKKATEAAHKYNAKIALDLLNCYTVEQVVMDAHQLGVDLLIFHKPHDAGNALDLIEQWETIKGNSSVPIFLAGGINPTNVKKILELKPDGIIVGTAINKSNNPALTASQFYNLVKKENK